jgi:rhamnosyltransferase
MQPSASNRAFAVVVAYLPDVGVLRALLDVLLAQTAGVFVVDNTPAADQRVEALCAALTQPALHLIRLGDNFGIARALNIGIEAALAVGATHVLLSDQDSLPAANMVHNLLQIINNQLGNGLKVGAAGPTYTDVYTKKTFPFKAIIPGKYFPGEILASETNPIVNALSLITSGTLIPANVFEEVGLMREDFFIDRVDTEWCLRARSRGFIIFGTIHATMYQRMGEHSLKVWYGTWQQLSSYAPIRVYYQIRNSMYMWRLNYIPTKWKIKNSWYALGMIYSHVFFSHQKRTYLIMSWRGFLDGILGKMGSYHDRL